MAVGSARDLCLSRIVDELSPGHALLALADYASLRELMRECSVLQIYQVVRCAKRRFALAQHPRRVTLLFLPPTVSHCSLQIIEY